MRWDPPGPFRRSYFYDHQKRIRKTILFLAFLWGLWMINNLLEFYRSTYPTYMIHNSEELLLNPDFQGRKYWRSLTPADSSYHLSKSGVVLRKEYVAINPPSNPLDVTGQYQFVDLRPIHQTSDPEFYNTLNFRASVREDKEGSKCQMAVDICCKDGNYIFDSYDLGLHFLDDNGWSWQNVSWSLHSPCEMSFLNLYFLREGGPGILGVTSASLTLDTTPRHVTGKVPSVIDHFPKVHQFPEYRVIPHRFPSIRDMYRGDVSIVTQLTPDQLPALETMCKVWEGPISAALYLQSQKEEDSLANSLQAFKNVDFHVVLARSGEPYPVNFLRNVALDNVRTEYIISIDVDMVPNPTMYGNVRKFCLENGERMKSQNTVYCLAAFEVNDEKFPPLTKERLLTLLDAGKARPLYQEAAPQMNRALNYKKWQDKDQAYAIKYENYFEPFLLGHKSIIRYDNRFRGYGWDKASHTYHLFQAGYNFAVYPNDYLIHSAHPTLEWEREKSKVAAQTWQHWYDFAFQVLITYRGNNFNYKKAVEADDLPVLVTDPDFSHGVVYVVLVANLQFLAFFLLLASFRWCGTRINLIWGFRKRLKKILRSALYE